MADRIELGSVVGVFGVRGELRLHLHNREESVLREPRSVTLVSPDGAERTATVSARPGAGKRIIGKVDGVGTPEDAAALMGWTVHIDRSQLPEAGEGEYYVADLIGLSVEDESGTALGTLADIVPGERDIWVVTTDAGEAFFIATPETLRRVDTDAGVVVIADGALTAGE